MYVDVLTFDRTAVCFCETSLLYGTKPLNPVQVDNGKLANIPYFLGSCFLPCPSSTEPKMSPLSNRTRGLVKKLNRIGKTEEARAAGKES